MKPCWHKLTYGLMLTFVSVVGLFAVTNAIIAYFMGPTSVYVRACNLFLLTVLLPLQLTCVILQQVIHKKKMAYIEKHAKDYWARGR